MPEITVIICTHNRANVIGATLKSLTNQTLAPDQFEVLVIDNACTDNTQAVVLDFQKNVMPRMRCIMEERLGIAIARNRGWQEAATEFVAYIDDDAQAEPNWLETHLISLKTLKPAPACVTGFVELDWTGGRPAWFPVQYESMLARYDFGSEPLWHKASGYLVTCNAAFRRQVLSDVGGFREGLGHKGGELHWRGGEDNDMFSKLIGEGLPVYYQPQARVLHLTPPERQTRKYLVWRIYASGSSQAVLDAISKKKRKRDLWRSIWLDGRMTVGLLVRLLIAITSESPLGLWDKAYQLVQKLGRLRVELAMVGIYLTIDDATRAKLWKSLRRFEKQT
jgi:glycosyltransferase involved in cell wall biosynthesis